MSADQELLLKIVTWKWPENEFEISLLTKGVFNKHIAVYRKTGEVVAVIHSLDTDFIEPLWQEHGQKVIEWKEKNIEHIRGKYSGTYTEIHMDTLSQSYTWLKSIATGTAHDKAVALSEWIDATGGK